MAVPEDRRRYGSETLGRLEFIAAAQRAGLALREIGEFSADFDVRELARRKLPDVHEQLERTRQIELWVQTASECDCASPDQCTLFDGDVALRIVHVDGCRRIPGD